jgi:hypothetical protein
LGHWILPWIPLMHGGGDLDTIEEWKRIAGLEPDGRRRSVYAALALVFAELAGRRAEWKQALEGWNMRQSMVITEWQDEARAAERLETRRADLFRFLQARFKIKVPVDLAAAVQEVVDSDELNRFIDIVATTDSLDAFRAAIQR